MTGRLQRLQPRVPEFHAVAIGERRERVFRARGRPEVNARAGSIAQLEVARDEVGVEVREKHVTNRQSLLGRRGQVLLDIALRIDDRRGVRLLVADEIRRVRQTVQVELAQDHASAVL